MFLLVSIAEWESRLSKIPAYVFSFSSFSSHKVAVNCRTFSPLSGHKHACHYIMLHHVTSYHTSYHTSLYIHDVTSYYNILHLPDLRNLPNLHNLPSSSGSVVGPMGDDSGSAWAWPSAWEARPRWPFWRRWRPPSSGGSSATARASPSCAMAAMVLRNELGSWAPIWSIDLFCFIWFCNMFQWLILIDIIWYYMIFLRREDHNPWAANNPFSQSLDAPLSSPNTENQG